jgi:DNA polymerase-1
MTTNLRRTMRTLIVDADSIAFKAAAAVQKGIRWDDDVYTSHADFGEAKSAFIDQVERLRAAIDDGADVVLAFSCLTRRYFRHDLLPTYKGNRGNTPSPLCYRDLREWAVEHGDGRLGYIAKVKPRLEADDVVGILATSKKLIEGEKIIISNDKDLVQVPGLHWAPEEGIYRVAPEAAERQLWMQVLTGDQVDNYTGIPGIGPAKARKILDTEEPYEDAVLKAYLKAGLTRDDMLIQLNVARILQAKDYDFRQKEPKLWK